MLSGDNDKHVRYNNAQITKKGTTRRYPPCCSLLLNLQRFGKKFEKLPFCLRTLYCNPCSIHLYNHITIFFSKTVIFLYAFLYTQTSHFKRFCQVIYCLLCQSMISVLQPQYSGFCRQRTIVIALPLYRCIMILLLRKSFNYIIRGIDTFCKIIHTVR